MSTLHPHTVQRNEAVPTDHDQLTDANVITRGFAEVPDEQAEAEYAGQQLDDATAQEIDEWTAASEMLNIYNRYGRSAFNAAMTKVEREVIKREGAGLGRTTDQVISAMREFLTGPRRVAAIS